MKSFVFGLSLASAAAAQIVVGMSMVPADNSAASESNSGLSMSMPTATGSGGYGGYAAPSQQTAPPSNSMYGGYAPPSQQTAPPSSSVDFYSIMPYSSYQAGGYKSLDCGYGYKKQSDGSCGQESWVSSGFFDIRNKFINRFAACRQYTNNGCYATTIININNK